MVKVKSTKWLVTVVKNVGGVFGTSAPETYKVKAATAEEATAKVLRDWRPGYLTVRSVVLA